MNYEIVKSKNNLDILKIGGIHIHSVFNPESEAAKIKYEGKNIIAVFGIGIGYHIKNIAANNPDSVLIVYDPLDDIRKLFFERYFDKKQFESVSIHFLDNIDEDKIFKLLDETGSISGYRFNFYSNSGYKRLFPDIESAFFNSIKKNIEILTQNIMTESSFYYLWTKNFIYNSRFFENHALINFKDCNPGDNLAVIVCAGPGLDKEMDSIKNVRENITLFAVDTAIKPLFKNGIRPDFVVSLDGQIHSLDDFIEDQSDDTCYIFDVVAYPQAARLVKKKYFSVTENIFSESLMELFCIKNGINAEGINTGGTVADYALDITRRLGFKNIYFSGLDLSFPDYRTHCKSSPFYDRTLYSSDYANSIETINAKTISARRLKTSSGKSLNENILTDFVLENYAFHIGRYQEVFSEINIFNSKQRGLKIAALQETELIELAVKLKSKRIPCDVIISFCDKNLICSYKLVEYYQQSLDSFYETSKILKEMLEKNDFASEKYIRMMENILNAFPVYKRIIRFSWLNINTKINNDKDEKYEREKSFVLLQSSYFFIRAFQKALKKNKNEYRKST